MNQSLYLNSSLYLDRRFNSRVFRNLQCCIHIHKCKLNVCISGDVKWMYSSMCKIKNKDKYFYFEHILWCSSISFLKRQIFTWLLDLISPWLSKNHVFVKTTRGTVIKIFQISITISKSLFCSSVKIKITYRILLQDGFSLEITWRLVESWCRREHRRGPLSWTLSGWKFYFQNSRMNVQIRTLCRTVEQVPSKWLTMVNINQIVNKPFTYFTWFVFTMIHDFSFLGTHHK